MANHRKVIKSNGVFIPKNKNFLKLTFLKKGFYLEQEKNEEDFVVEVLDGGGADDGILDEDEVLNGDGGLDEDGLLDDDGLGADYDFSDIEIVYEITDGFDEVSPEGKIFSYDLEF